MKQWKKKAVSSFLCLTLLFGEGNILASAAEPEESIVHYLYSMADPYISIANRVDELRVGDSHRFVAVVNQWTNSNIVWESTNPEVAYIGRKSGELIALSPGTTRIRVWDFANDYIAYSYELLVSEVPECEELPAEWYTLEACELQEGDRTICGVRIVLQEEYQSLFETYQSLTIPRKIKGKRVLDIRMEDSETGKEAGANLYDWGFSRLKKVKCPQELAWCVKGYYREDGTYVGAEEVIFSNPDECITDSTSSVEEKVHFAEHTISVLDTAFESDNLQYVRIPADVTEIRAADGGAGIDYGEKLSFAVDGANTSYYSIFGILFSYPTYAEEDGERLQATPNTLVAYPRNKAGSAYKVQNGVERIGERAFEGAANLKKIVLSDSVREIGAGAFADFKHPVTIEIPASVTIFEDSESANAIAGENVTIVTPQGSAAEAYAIEHGIRYRAPKPEPVFTLDMEAKLKGVKVGDLITFGRYQQDDNRANGLEEIEWAVLAKEKGRLLLISRYALDNGAYHRVYEGYELQAATWADCELRKWLNEEFYQTAFFEEEQEYIIEAELKTHIGWSTKNQELITRDRVFVLSKEEAVQYLQVDVNEPWPECCKSARAKVTTYAKHGLVPLSTSGFDRWGRTEYEYDDSWWLRSSEEKKYADYVDILSWSDSTGAEDTVAIRPAIWIKIP